VGKPARYSGYRECLSIASQADLAKRKALPNHSKKWYLSLALLTIAGKNGWTKAPVAKPSHKTYSTAVFLWHFAIIRSVLLRYRFQ
jgi:hypothetical protein